MALAAALVPLAAIPSLAKPSVGGVVYRVDSVYSSGALTGGRGYFLTMVRAALATSAGGGGYVAGYCLQVDTAQWGDPDVGCGLLDPNAWPVVDPTNGFAHLDVTVPSTKVSGATLHLVGDFTADFPLPLPDERVTEVAPTLTVVAVNTRPGQVTAQVTSPATDGSVTASVSYLSTSLATSAGASLDARGVVRAMLAQRPPA